MSKGSSPSTWTQWTMLMWSVILVGAVVATAQETQVPASGPDEIAQRWLEFMTPGAEHEMLQQRVGRWTVTMQMWPAPGADVIASTGTSEVKSIMGGRYLTHTTRGSFQDQPFEGVSIVGFDKLKKKFVSVWIDNFGTGFTVSTGSYDEAKREFHYSTMSPDVPSGQYKRTRTVERVVGADEWILEMFDTTPAGTEYKSMMAVYRRVK